MSEFWTNLVNKLNLILPTITMCQYYNVVTNRQKIDSIRFGFVSYFSSRSSFRFEFGIILIWKKKSRNLPLQCMCALLFLIPFLFNKRGAGPRGAGPQGAGISPTCFLALHLLEWFQQREAQIYIAVCEREGKRCSVALPLSLSPNREREKESL